MRLDNIITAIQPLRVIGNGDTNTDIQQLLTDSRELTVRDRLERAFYFELDRVGIVMKFAGGERIL